MFNDVVSIPGDPQFEEIVNNEARNNLSTEESAWLREEDIVEKWHKQLVMLLNKVECQLSHHKAERAAKRIELSYEDNDQEGKTLYLTYIAQAEKWRAQALWFRKTLLDRVFEAKALIAEYQNYDSYTYDDAEIVDDISKGRLVARSVIAE